MHHEHRDRREERREERHERHDRGRGGRDDEYDNYGAHRGQRHHDADAQSYPSHGQGYGYGQGQGQGQGRATGGYTPPSGPPPQARGPSGFASQGGLERADFLSDEEIQRMVTSGEFNERQARRGYDEYGSAGGERGRYDAPAGPPAGQGYGGRANEYGRYDPPSGPPLGQGYGERTSEHGRYDAPSGPPLGQGYGERTSEHGRYDAPPGPPPGRGYQSQQPHQGYGSGGESYGGGPDRPNQYGSQQQQGRSPYDTPQALQAGSGRSQGNAPSGGFTASRGEEQYGSGYGGARSDRDEPPRRGEGASYYNQQGPSGQADRYSHLAGIAQEQGDNDPELYRQATQGLQDRIQTQGQSRRSGDEDDHLKSHVDAHRKAYGEDDHGPMDADTIGAAAAMEAFKQTATKAPAGGFTTNKASGDSSKPGRATRDEDEEEEEATTAARAGGSGGMQDKLMALAMSQAGKLFDKKNGGSSGGDKTQDKAQAMQSAAATAMQLFTQYQSKGKLDSGDMSKVMGLASKLF